MLCAGGLATQMPYDHFEHCHRFAVWASARATQRGFTTTENLRDALESTCIRKFLAESKSTETDAKTFNSHHRKWCNAIVKFLSNKKIKNVTYGRAAKLVAVYLKAMVIIGARSKSRLAAVAHPPIDSLLLRKLADSFENSPHKTTWRATAWTKLDEKAYYELLATLRSVVPAPEPWWKIEKYWPMIRE